MARNYFASPFETGMDAFDRSYDRTGAMRQDRARAQAGRALAGGDRRGAMEAFGGAGMVDGVRQMQADQQVEQDRAAEAQGAEREQQAAQAKERLTFFSRAATALSQVPLGEGGDQTARRAALQKLTPIMQQFITDPAALESLGTADLSDESLRMFVGELKRYEQTFHNPEHGIFGVTGQGRVDTLKSFPRKPLVVPQTSNVFMPEDAPEDQGGDTISGGSGSDGLLGGAGGDTIPGYRKVQSGRPPQGRQPPAQGRPLTDADRKRFGIPPGVSGFMKPDGTPEVIDYPKGQSPEDAEKAKQRNLAFTMKAEDIISTVDDTLGKIGDGPGSYSGEAGIMGKTMSAVPGTKAYDVARQIETIKANLGFQELQAMREASPTGGALGQVAVQELVALQSTVANLDIGQSDRQLRANLAKVKRHYENWLDMMNGKPARHRQTQARGSGPKPVKQMSNDELKKALGL